MMLRLLTTLLLLLPLTAFSTDDSDSLKSGESPVDGGFVLLLDKAPSAAGTQRPLSTKGSLPLKVKVLRVFGGCPDADSVVTLAPAAVTAVLEVSDSSAQDPKTRHAPALKETTLAPLVGTQDFVVRGTDGKAAPQDLIEKLKAAQVGKKGIYVWVSARYYMRVWPLTASGSKLPAGWVPDTIPVCLQDGTHDTPILYGVASFD